MFVSGLVGVDLLFLWKGRCFESNVRWILRGVVVVMIEEKVFGVVILDFEVGMIDIVVIN